MESLEKDFLRQQAEMEEEIRVLRRMLRNKLRARKFIGIVAEHVKSAGSAARATPGASTGQRT